MVGIMTAVSRLWPQEQVADYACNFQYNYEYEAGVAAAIHQFAQISTHFRHLLTILVKPSIQIIQQFVMNIQFLLYLIIPRLHLPHHTNQVINRLFLLLLLLVLQCQQFCLIHRLLVLAVKLIQVITTLFMSLAAFAAAELGAKRPRESSYMRFSLSRSSTLA